MDGRFLIPANTKKGLLILGMFKKVDLAILITGISISLIIFIILSNFNIEGWAKIAALAPGAISAFLVFPIPNYHNVRTGIAEIMDFYSNIRVYKWRGWCALYESNRSEQHKQ